MQHYLPAENAFAGKVVRDWRLEEEVGRGNNSVVYRAHREVLGVKDFAAVKILPVQNLKHDWQQEILKVLPLQGVPQVIQYKEHFSEFLGEFPYACIVTEFVQGQNLREYARANSGSITLPLVEAILDELLQACVAMQVTGVTHGDLHEGNVLVAVDARRFEQRPVVKVTDFGIGSARNHLVPKDDGKQLAMITLELLSRYIDPSALDNADDREFYKYLVNEYIPRILLERNHAVGEHVNNPRRQLEILRDRRRRIAASVRQEGAALLNTPFDYLSCEQLADSFELLQKLYSSNFPGYQYMFNGINTLLTGPRGCGKTTILRNLALKTELLAGSRDMQRLPEYLGVYFHCKDLYFAFHYLRETLTKQDQEIVVHYVNLSLLRELLDAFVVAAEFPGGEWDARSVQDLETVVREAFPAYGSPPSGTPLLRHLLAYVEAEKHRVGLWLRRNRRGQVPYTVPLPRDFIPQLAERLQTIVPWLGRRPIFFFLDDYSTPNVSPAVQATINDFAMQRWSACFFKISTESIATFHPHYSNQKLIEETREYDVIDLGAQFLSDPERRASFLTEVINNRLRYAKGIHDDYKQVNVLLGPNSAPSYNELARQIRGEDKRSRVQYAGIQMLSDLFSGDLADMLRLVAGMFTTIGPYEVFSRPGLELPFSPRVQDKAIREYGNSFLSRVEAAPRHGQKLRKIVEAFGTTAHWMLMTKDSKNETGSPPKQAFRIEIRETIDLTDRDQLRRHYDMLVPAAAHKRQTFNMFCAEISEVYHNLIRYGVFIRDVRGKSPRGSIVPRLYMRRLLIPTFKLTPNQRDNVSLEPGQFIFLLHSPDKFVAMMKQRNDDGQTGLSRYG